LLHVKLTGMLLSYRELPRRDSDERLQPQRKSGESVVVNGQAIVIEDSNRADRGIEPFFLFVDPPDQRTRVMSCTQFVSQVLPSSGESACSQWHDVGVMLDQMKRARTRFPLTVSSP
jgi:hypothetical protein